MLLVEFLLETGALASAATHEVKLSAADFAVAFNNYLVDARGAEQEGTRYAYAVGFHTANSNGSVIATLAEANNDALELLNTFAVAFLDFDMNADRVPGTPPCQVRWMVR